jgi:hypothetical protein
MSGIVVLTRPSHGCMHFKQNFLVILNLLCTFFGKSIDFEKFVQGCNKLLNIDVGKFVGS